MKNDFSSDGGTGGRAQVVMLRSFTRWPAAHLLLCAWVLTRYRPVLTCGPGGLGTPGQDDEGERGNVTLSEN